MFKVYKTDKKKRKEELIYERYEEKKDKLTLKRDELYKILNEEFSKYCYDYSPLTPLNIEILMNNMKDEYFNAVVKYLRTGEEENLIYGDYSTNIIKGAYGVEKLDYIKAVVILDNIEKLGVEGCYAFFPYMVE